MTGLKGPSCLCFLFPENPRRCPATKGRAQFSGFGNIQTFTVKRKPAERRVPGRLSAGGPLLSGSRSSQPFAIMGAEGLQARCWGKNSFGVPGAQILAPAERHGQLLHLSEPFCAMEKIILAFKVVEASKRDLSPKRSLLGTYCMQSLFWPCRYSSGHRSWN